MRPTGRGASRGNRVAVQDHRIAVPHHMVDPILPGALNPVHRCVRYLERLSARVDRGLERHGADAERHRPPTFRHGPDELLMQVLQYRSGGSARDFRQDPRKFVSSQAPEHVRLSRAGPECVQPPGEGARRPRRVPPGR